MRLHDGLEVESSTIPEGKLSTAGCSQATTALWRPSHDVDGMLDFVERLVDPAAWHGVRSAGRPCSRGNHLRPRVSIKTDGYLGEFSRQRGSWDLDVPDGLGSCPCT